MADGDPLDIIDHDSEVTDTGGDGDAGPSGGSSTGGGRYSTTPSGDTLSRRKGVTHSIPDQKATGQEATPGACALDTAEMSCHELARTPSLSTHSAPLPPPSPLSLSAHSPPSFSLFSHWDSGRQRGHPPADWASSKAHMHPPPRRKLCGINGNRDDLDEDANDVDEDVDECYTDANEDDAGEDGDDEEDVDDVADDRRYVDEDADACPNPL